MTRGRRKVVGGFIMHKAAWHSWAAKVGGGGRITQGCIFFAQGSVGC